MNISNPPKKSPSKKKKIIKGIAPPEFSATADRLFDPWKVVPAHAMDTCRGLYGAPPMLTMFEAEQWAFIRNLSPENGGLGRYLHFRRMCAYLFPKLEWNEWLEDIIEALCNNFWVGFPGCAGSGKTFGTSLYAVVWWLCMPEASSVILTSTTKDMIRKRAWGNVQWFYNNLPGDSIGNMVDSRTSWQATKGDDKHAISAIAVRQGSTSEAVARIQGYHTRRQLVIVDEATDTPSAIFDACANLFNGPEEFQFICIGNPHSHLDPFGQFCEPIDGWKSVTVETRSWKSVVTLAGVPGYVLRFDAEKSPNVLSGEVVAPHLVTKEQLEGARARYGENSPLFWKFQRGFWAPEGISKTIFSEPLIVKMDAMESLRFTGKGFFRVAGVDPAFGGGDRPMLCIAKVGMGEDGKNYFEQEEMLELDIDASSKEPVHFQLAAQVIKHCNDKGIELDRCAVDETGEGGGFCDILQREAGKDVIRVTFGASASDRPTSDEDMRTAKEVYFNKSVELWHRAREFLLAGQIRGLDNLTAVELCNRTFDDSKAKIRLQSKKEMKEEFGMSPDRADAWVLALEAAQVNGLTLGSFGGLSGAEGSRSSQWDKVSRDFDEVYDGLGDEYD